MRGYVSQLKYDKNEFRILALLWANGGKYSGNMSALCSSLGLSNQTNNKTRVRKSLEILQSNHDINVLRKGWVYQISLVEKQEQGFEIDDSFMKIRDNYIGKSFQKDEVAWENILKIILWQMAHREKDIMTSKEIADDCDLSVTLVNSAFRAMKRYFPEYGGGNNIRVKINERYDYKGRENDYNAIGWNYRKDS